MRTKDYRLILFALALASLAPVLFFVTAAFAQDAPAEPKVDLSLLQSLIVAVIPVVTGLVMMVVRNAVARIPNAYIPVLAPVVGLLVEAVAQAFGTSLVPGVDGAGALPVAAALGSASVGAHQIKSQLAGR